MPAWPGLASLMSSERKTVKWQQPLQPHSPLYSWVGREQQGSLGLARAAQVPGSQWLHNQTEPNTDFPLLPLHSAVSLCAELICRCFS